MGSIQHAKALSDHAATFFDPDRLMQIAAKTEASPKAGKRAG